MLPFQYTKEYSSRDLATIELPLDAKTCSHILQGKIDITAQWQDDNGGAAVVYDTRRVIIQEEGPPRPAFPPTTGNSNFNFPPKPQMFSRGAEVRDATGQSQRETVNAHGTVTHIFCCRLHISNPTRLLAFPLLRSLLRHEQKPCRRPERDCHCRQITNLQSCHAA